MKFKFNYIVACILVMCFFATLSRGETGFMKILDYILIAIWFLEMLRAMIFMRDPDDSDINIDINIEEKDKEDGGTEDR